MPKKLQVNIGDKFGDRTYIGGETTKSKSRYIFCQCKCGTKCYVRLANLRNGRSKKCNECYKNKINKGDKFGLRTYTGIEKNINNKRHMLCECKCGIRKYIYITPLIKQRSLGCKRCTMIGKNVSHGLSSSRLYHIYDCIKQRCNNPKHKSYIYYGQRGITCERNSFEEFKNDMYESYIEHVNKYGIKNTTIDRIDVNGNYCNGNCRRATCKEQAQNKRKK